MYAAKIIADSINPVGCRLTTFELTYPRFVHAELLTHRMFSRNSASSRAIPTPKLIERIQRDPVLPKWWGKNQSGMQARQELDGPALDAAQDIWLRARDMALEYAAALRKVGLHKQIANRIIEPWMFITVIVTATEWDNWYHLRDSEFAQPEIAWVAREMRRLHEEHEPEAMEPGQWHLPYVEPPWGDEDHPLYVSDDEFLEASSDPVWMETVCPVWETTGGGGIRLPAPSIWYFLRAISAARCARVSYLTHDGIRDLDEDLALHNRLAGSGHWSPFEHPAECLPDDERHGNFYGWVQYRKSAGRVMP